METDEEFVALRECGQKYGINDPLRTLFTQQDLSDIPLDVAMREIRVAAAARTP